MFTHILTYLEPPYSDDVPLLGKPAAPAAIAVARIATGRSSNRGPSLVEALERTPWAAPCLVLAPASISAVLLQHLFSLPGQPAFLTVTDPMAPIPPAVLLAAVRGRPAPTPSFLASYAVRRTGSVRLGQTLSHIWGPAHGIPSSIPDRTLRYQLHQLGDLARSDWNCVERLVRIKTQPHTWSVEQQAQFANTEARTMRGWVSRYLGVSLKTFRGMVGWEWIMELTLRRGGFKLIAPQPGLAPLHRAMAMSA